MKSKLILGLFLLMVLAVFSCGPEPDSSAGDGEGDGKDIPAIDDSINLYTKWPFPVGAAVPGAATSNLPGSPNNNALLPASAQHKILRHFNVYVAENEMKPYQILPSNSVGEYRWTNADALVDYAEANGKRIRGHVLFWHDQTPDWFFEGTGKDGRATIGELYARMEAHVKAVFGKYGGRIEWWDVVNEAVDHDDSGARANSNYTQIMKDSGMNDYDYIVKAFELARAHAPANVKLYLTDYGVERPFTRGGTTKQDDFFDLVKYLIENDAPIDGVGFQGHFRLYDHPVNQIEEGIEMFAALQRKDGKKLTVQICELDFSIFSNEKSDLSATVTSNLPERLKDLADNYRAFFDMFERQYTKGNLDMVLIWGLADGHSWLNEHTVNGRTDHPLLYDRNYNAKEAYARLVENR